MKFALIGYPTIEYTLIGRVTVAGIACVKGTAVIRRRNRKGTGFRNVTVETVARIEDVDIVANVATIEA